MRIDSADFDDGLVVIDLRGPDGNAFALLGYMRRIATQMGWTPEQIEALADEMTSSDYENLVSAFDREFGEFIMFIE